MIKRNKLGDRVVDNIRYLRHLRNWTQHQLAAYANLSTNYINAIERYTYYPSFGHIEKNSQGFRS